MRACPFVFGRGEVGRLDAESVGSEAERWGRTPRRGVRLFTRRGDARLGEVGDYRLGEGDARLGEACDSWRGEETHALERWVTIGSERGSHASERRATLDAERWVALDSERGTHASERRATLGSEK